MKHTEFYHLRLKDRWFTEFYYLSPTDNTDFLDIYLHSLFDWLFCYAKIALRITQMPCGVFISN